MLWLRVEVFLKAGKPHMAQPVKATLAICAKKILTQVGLTSLDEWVVAQKVSVARNAHRGGSTIQSGLARTKNANFSTKLSPSSTAIAKRLGDNKLFALDARASQNKLAGI